MDPYPPKKSPGPGIAPAVILIVCLACLVMTADAAASVRVPVTATTTPSPLVLRTVPIVTVTTQPTVTCPAPCSCMDRQSAVSTWGADGFLQCAEVPCAYEASPTGADGEKYCFRPKALPTTAFVQNRDLPLVTPAPTFAELVTVPVATTTTLTVSPVNPPGKVVAPSTLHAPDNLCGGTMVDLATDLKNCGWCGNICDSTKNLVCTGGVCQCKKDMLLCDTNQGCIDVNYNWQNCGSCGNVCKTPEVCVMGHCEFEPTCGSKNYQTNVIETCVDGVKNQDESGVDCGGRCAPCNTKCTTGAKYAPADTPCTSVYHYQSTLASVPSSNYPDDPFFANMYYDECQFCNYPCRSNEVCHPALDPMIEEAEKCCSQTSLADIDALMPEPAICKYAVKMAQHSCKKCTGVYIIKELADGTRWMDGYHDEQNTAKANVSKNAGTEPPYGTANYLLNYYHTGICHDYALAVTSLLRKDGYSLDEVGSTCDGAHCYNVVKFPGDTKWHVVDTDSPNEGGATWKLGQLQGGYPYCHTMDETSIFYMMNGYNTTPVADVNAYWNTVGNGQNYPYPHVTPFLPQCANSNSATPCSIVYGGPPLSGPGVGGAGKDYWRLPDFGVKAKQLVGC
jgi:hypothetical protein